MNLEKNFKFKKKYGQNFLKSTYIIDQIIKESNIDKETLVIEIGPGSGALTKMMSPLAKNIISFEIDESLEETLNNNLKNLNNVDIIFKDFLEADIKKEIEYMVFQEEIIYIRYLCGIDYPYSLEEVEIQDREEPPVYALRNECDRMAAASGYRNELEQEFGRQIFVEQKREKI